MNLADHDAQARVHEQLLHGQNTQRITHNHNQNSMSDTHHTQIYFGMWVWP